MRAKINAKFNSKSRRPVPGPPKSSVKINGGFFGFKTQGNSCRLSYVCDFLTSKGELEDNSWLNLILKNVVLLKYVLGCISIYTNKN